YSDSGTGANFNCFSETGEPTHLENDPNTVWWNWTAPANGTAGVNTVGSDFDTVLWVYTGNAVNNLTYVANNDDGGGIFGGVQTSLVSFNAVAGTTYHMQIFGKGGAEGNIVINAKLYPNNDDFADAVNLPGASASVTGFNYNATGETGEPSPAPTSTPLNSVWYTWTAPYSGPVTIDTFGSDFDTTLAVYTGNSVGALSQVTTNDDYGGGVTSRVWYMASAGTTYHIAVDGFAYFVGNIDLHLDLRPENDNFASPYILASYPDAAFGTNVNATGEPGEPIHAGVSLPMKSVWWQWTAPAAGEVTINTDGSEFLFDTALAVYTGDSVSQLTEVASNDDVNLAANEIWSQVKFMAVPFTTYHIAVAGTFGDSGAIQLNLVLNSAPVADAGGSGNVPEGGSILLNGLGSYDPQGSIAGYEWDLDYDGVTFNVDSTSATPTFSALNLDGPTTRTVALRVTDNTGLVS